MILPGPVMVRYFGQFNRVIMVNSTIFIKAWRFFTGGAQAAKNNVAINQVGMIVQRIKVNNMLGEAVVFQAQFFPA